MKDKKSLIIYFSRADENYAVGYIDKGNTEIVAEYVRDLTGADMFKVEPLVLYAKDYATCIEEAKQRIGNAPIKEEIKDISTYEVIYIMSPIYWGTYAPEIETAIKVFIDGGYRVNNVYYSGLKIGEDFIPHKLAVFLDEEIPELKNITFNYPTDYISINDEEKGSSNNITIEMM